jgi:hypothetical protein
MTCLQQSYFLWYQDDFSARLKPGAKRILMNTRWHEEDVAGRVQALPSLDTEVPGLRNEGLFALHALTGDMPRRPEWTAATVKAALIAVLIVAPLGQQIPVVNGKLAVLHSEPDGGNRKLKNDKRFATAGRRGDRRMVRPLRGSGRRRRGQPQAHHGGGATGTLKYAEFAQARLHRCCRLVRIDELYPTRKCTAPVHDTGENKAS